MAGIEKFNWKTFLKAVADGRKDFSKCMLQGIDLSGCENLQGLDFSEATLENANFNGSNLSGSNFSNANLKKANLSATTLDDCNFSKANLSKANLKLADFYKSELSRACLNNVDASKACFLDANLNDADLEEANLENANLEYASIERANLKKARLVNAGLDNTSLKYSNLDSANLEHATLNCTKLDDANLTNTVLSKENVQKSKDAQVNVKSKDVTNPVTVINKEVSKKLIEKVTHVDVHKKEDKMSKAKEIGKAVVFRAAIDESVQVGKAVILELLSLLGVRKNSKFYKFFASEFSNIVVKGAVGLFLYFCPFTQEEKWQNIANELMTQAGFSTLKESIDLLLGFISPHAAKLVGMIEKLTSMQSEVRVDAPEVKARIQEKKEEHIEEEEEVIPLVSKKAIAI